MRLTAGDVGDVLAIEDGVLLELDLHPLAAPLGIPNLTLPSIEKTVDGWSGQSPRTGVGPWLSHIPIVGPGAWPKKPSG